MINPHQINRLRYLLTILHICGSHTKIGRNLSELFVDLESLQCADPTYLQTMRLNREKITEKISVLRKPDQSIKLAIEQELVWANEEDQHIVTIDDVDYPILLKEISDPPLVLFVKGDKKILHNSQLAIVGSRNPSSAGVENAYVFAQHLVKVGLTVTSGFAIGIDAAAHRGALAVSGPTIAVMGAGLNHIYPQRHRHLVPEIIAHNGALISEFPLQVPPLADNFPQRNRIISGLSLGTLVVEATLRSGSLITAHQAVEQGREVFAIPSSIHSQLASGCHTLIRQGAKLVENVSDILEEIVVLEVANMKNTKKKMEINEGVNGDIRQINRETDQTKTSTDLTDKDKKLLACIGYEAVPVDVLAARSNLTIVAITSMLLPLELKGYVQKVSGGYTLCAYRDIA